MTVRERIEESEHLLLSPRAAFADASLGREREEDGTDTEGSEHHRHKILTG